MTTYDDQNIFAKILRGEIPCTKVYEDEETLCFMDIMPRVDGHCLVIPKTPCRNMLDASTAQLSACLQTVQKVSHAALKGLGATGVTIQQFNEADGGQEVFHLHYHILPRHTDTPMRAPGKMGDMDTIAQLADRIKAAL